jgi:hypothetical protein
MIYTGIGFVGTLALSSFGLPPIGGLITRSFMSPFYVNPLSITPTSTHSAEEIFGMQ